MHYKLDDHDDDDDDDDGDDDDDDDVHVDDEDEDDDDDDDDDDDGGDDDDDADADAASILCEPAQSKCTWTCHKEHFVGNLQGKCRTPRIPPRLNTGP